MIINPIIPLWLMVPICIILILMKRKGVIPFLRQLLIIVLLFAINLRIMIPGEGGTQVTKQRDLQVVFVIDKTISMLANDYDGHKERLEGVKADCSYIIDHLAGSNFSVISYHNMANVMSPFTEDTDHVKATIDSIYPIDTSAARGTNVGVAKQCLLDLLKSHDNNKKTVVFFISDGENNSKEKMESFAEVAEYIDGGAVLGYGTTKGGTMTIRTGYTADYYEEITDWSEWPSKPAVSKLDEGNLKKIAGEMGIEYVHMEKTQVIDRVLTTIEKQSTLETDMKQENAKNDKTDGATDLYYLFVIPLVIMLCVEGILFVVKKEM